MFFPTLNVPFISTKQFVFTTFKLPKIFVSPPMEIFLLIPIPPFITKHPELILLLSNVF